MVARWQPSCSCSQARATAEVDQILLLLRWQPFEAPHYPACFAAGASVSPDLPGPGLWCAVMQEEDSLSNAHSVRCGIRRPGSALGDAVGQAAAHVVDQQVRVQVDGWFDSAALGDVDEPLAIALPVLSIGVWHARSRLPRRRRALSRSMV